MLRGLSTRLPERLGRKRAPIWLWLFAVLGVGQPMVSGIASGLSPLLLGFIVFEILFAWLLLRGGRAVWCVAVLVQAIGLLAPVWGEPAWWAGLSLLGLALLLAPASRAYVWREARLRREEQAAHGLTARLASGALWEGIWHWIGAKALNWNFIGWLALSFLLALVLSGVLGSARNASGGDSLVLAVLEGVVATVNVVSFLALLCLLAAMGIKALMRRLHSRT